MLKLLKSTIEDTIAEFSAFMLAQTSDQDIVEEASKRGFNPASTGIVPWYISQSAVSIQQWASAVSLAENRATLMRYPLYRIYDNTMLDLHLSSLVDDRTLALQSLKTKLINESNKDHPDSELLCKNWFNLLEKYYIEAKMYGFSLVELTNMNYQNDITNTLTLIPRSHVRPEENRWLVNTQESVLDHTLKGILPKTFINDAQNYSLEPAKSYYIPIGEPNDLGWLKKITPIALAKRYALAAWSEYDDKIGIPFRWITMRGTNNAREKLLGNIMEKMGPSGWAVLHEGEEVKLLEKSGSDPHKCFLELINLCDEQMSKAIIGSTMTKDAAGGQYKGDVHQNTANLRFEADEEGFLNLVNEELIPRLINLGWPLKGYKLVTDEKKELTLTEQLEIDKVLLEKYDLEPEYISEKYGIDPKYIKKKAF